MYQPLRYTFTPTNPLDNNTVTSSSGNSAPGAGSALGTGADGITTLSGSKQQQRLQSVANANNSSATPQPVANAPNSSATNHVITNSDNAQAGNVDSENSENSDNANSGHVDSENPDNSDYANPGYVNSDSDDNSDPSEELRNAPDIWTFGQDYERLLANPNRTTRSGKHFHKEINTASSQNRRGRNPRY